ncbi:hypothetical protein PYCC9005_001409 [Savitreella phatthalungensis]
MTSIEPTEDEVLHDGLNDARSRIFLLRLEQRLTQLVSGHESHAVIDAPSAYLRLLAHKLGSRFALEHVTSASKRQVIFTRVPTSRPPGSMLNQANLDSDMPAVGSLRIMKRADGDVHANDAKSDEPVHATDSTLAVAAASTSETDIPTADPDSGRLTKEERYRLARARIFEGDTASGSDTASLAHSGEASFSRQPSRDSPQKITRDQSLRLHSTAAPFIPRSTLVQCESAPDARQGDLAPVESNRNHDHIARWSQFATDQSTGVVAPSAHEAASMRGRIRPRALWEPPADNPAPLSAANLAALERSLAIQSLPVPSRASAVAAPATTTPAAAEVSAGLDLRPPSSHGTRVRAGPQGVGRAGVSQLSRLSQQALYPGLSVRRPTGRGPD